MILTFGKHIGEELEAQDSSYLCLVITEFDWVDWTVKNAARIEMRRRLSLDWTIPATNPDKAVIAGLTKDIDLLNREVERLRAESVLLQKVCWLHGVEEHPDYAKYFRNPGMIEEDMAEANEKGFRVLPHHFSETNLFSRVKTKCINRLKRLMATIADQDHISEWKRMSVVEEIFLISLRRIKLRHLQTTNLQDK